MNHLSYIGNFTAHDAAECRAHAAEKAHRLDAVADDHAARNESLEAHAVDFVARQTGQFGCALHVAIVRYSGPTVDARFRRAASGATSCQAATRCSRGSPQAAQLGKAAGR